MKKFLALLLAFIMVVLPLISCNKLEDLIEDEFNQNEEETKKKTDEKDHSEDDEKESAEDDEREPSEDDEKETSEDNEKDPSETFKNPFEDWFGGNKEPTTSDQTYVTEDQYSNNVVETSYPWDGTNEDVDIWPDDPWHEPDVPSTDYPWHETSVSTDKWTDYPWGETTAPSTDYPWYGTDFDVPSTDYPWYETSVPADKWTDYPWDETATMTDVPETDSEYDETFVPDIGWDETTPDITDELYTDPTMTPSETDDTYWEDETFTESFDDGTVTSPDDYIDVDLEGEAINIVIRNQISVQREWYKDVPEDVIDEIIAMRNERVASMINVEVNYTLLGSSNYEECLSAFNAAIMEDVDNDFHYYDIVANYAYAGANELVRDYIANMADTDVFPYFDFSLPCWNQSIVNTTLIDDQLYYITGDLNLSTFDKTMVVFVNKDVYADMKAESDPEDLQDVALEGSWDYDDLYRWASVYDDTNSDTVKDHEDFYAISADFGSIPIDAMPYAWDLDFIIEEADGSHSYNIEGNDKIAKAVEMAKNLFNGANGEGRLPLAEGVGNWNNTNGCTMGGYSEPITHFANDKTIFALHLLYCTADDNQMLREMQCEFGLLPMPKYDEDQENYGTTAHDAYTLMTVIDHSWSSEKTKGEAISAYLQLASEENYENVRGYYINEIIKQKYFGLNESLEKSQEIFDIIVDNIELPFISVYAPQLNNVLNSCWREVVTENNNIGATTAEEAFTLDQFSYELALESVDSWLGLI